MADISKVLVDGTEYNVKDTVARSGAGVELTRAQYDALSDEEKHNGTTYFIIDEQGGRDDLGLSIVNGAINITYTEE